MSQTSPGHNWWCRRYRPARNPAARLVCLPHAGGSASFFLPLAEALSPRVDVVAIQYPGRQDRHAEPPIDDIGVLADQIYTALELEPELPLILLGHSMGAIVGFEVTRRLEAGQHGPARLVVSGRRAPATDRNEIVHLRDDDGIIAEIRKLSGTAAEVLSNDEIMRAALPALRADYTATETYTCAPDITVNCPITVLTGDSDPKTTLAEARAWGKHTTSSIDLHVFTGGHFFISDHVGDVIKLITQHLHAMPAHAPI
jgi:surfactin synthase thioesterase subunit